jgi:hypothetical protein
MFCCSRPRQMGMQSLTEIQRLHGQRCIGLSKWFPSYNLRPRCLRRERTASRGGGFGRGRGYRICEFDTKESVGLSE